MTSFPLYFQFDSCDCGPACLRMISSYYGVYRTSHVIRRYCRIDKDGVSLYGITNAAEKIGFNVTTNKLSWEAFLDAFNGPCIVHWTQNHFILLS